MIYAKIRKNILNGKKYSGREVNTLKERRTPMRRCIGCMESKEKNALVRIVAQEGKVTIDLTGRAKGRGAYLCRNSRECWKKAAKRKAFERSLGISVSEDEKAEIYKALQELSEPDEG